jgi:hypothetical protein
VLKIEKHVGRVDELQDKVAARETAQKEGTLGQQYSIPEPIIVKRGMRLRGGGPKQRGSSAKNTKVVDNDEKTAVWVHIFICGFIKDKQSGEAFVARVRWKIACVMR